MRAICLALALLSCLSPAAWPAWYENNPDHTPSIGFAYGGKDISGSIPLSGNVVDISERSGVSTFDLRFPVSNRMTWTGVLGYTKEAYQSGAYSTPEANVPAVQQNLYGFVYQVGVRFYFDADDRPELPNNRVSPPRQPAGQEVPLSQGN